MDAKEEVIDGILKLNFQLRTLEESLANILNMYDSGIVLEKVTDKTMLANPPVTSLEGLKEIEARLNDIEKSFINLVPNVAFQAIQTVAQYKQILADELKNTQ